MNLGLRTACFALLLTALPAWSAQTTPAPAPSPSPTADQINFFEQKIRPVLSAKCYKCHAKTSLKVKAGLYLDSRDGILKGSEAGPIIDLDDKPEESLLISVIKHEEEGLEMPPKEKLTNAVIADFVKWTKMGLPFPEPRDKEEVNDVAWWDEVDLKKLQPNNKSVSQTIDHYINDRLKQEKVKPVGKLTDHQFIRRVTLDLEGRIPTVAEINEYIESNDKNKAAKLVDKLMSSSAYARHQVVEFDWALTAGQTKSMKEYLSLAFGDNLGWDDIFRQVVLPSPKDEKHKGADQFLKDRVSDLDKLTNDVAVQFFGINVSCAQCHDHPEVPSWKQDHYYGMKSFLSRTFDNGGFLGEREYGLVSFKTTKGEQKQAKLMFLDGVVFDEPENEQPSKDELAKEKKKLEELKKQKVPPPAPKFSRRAKLVEAGLRKGKDGLFSRALVNRVWHRFFGRGMVEPIDQLHGANVPTHPELLVWLARDFSDHDYNINRLIKGIVLSDTYARSSVWTNGDRPSASLFAVADPRPLTPQQFGTSLAIASSNPDQWKLDKPDEFSKRIESSEGSGRGWHAHFPRQGSEFSVSVNEALIFSNNDRVQRDLLSDSNNKIVGRVKQLENDGEAISLMYLTVLGRQPDEQELDVIGKYIASRKDDPTKAWQQVAWALFSGAEFRFNH